MSDLVIELCAAPRLHDLRRRVLRGGDPEKNVVDPRDGGDEALHVVGLLGERPVVSASFYPCASPDHPDAVSYQLRYLATDFDVQRRGYASRVLAVGEAHLRQRGCTVLWANGRDTALDFYRREGWREVAGSEHLSAETQLPHTRIYKDFRE